MAIRDTIITIAVNNLIQLEVEIVKTGHTWHTKIHYPDVVSMGNIEHHN